MSRTKLVFFENGIATDCVNYQNSWQGAIKIWTAIFDKYCEKNSPYDNALNAAIDGRLWQLWETKEFKTFEKVVFAFTMDNLLVSKTDFKLLADSLDKFVEEHLPNDPGHLSDWADMLRSNNACKYDAVGLHITTVVENPWFPWDSKNQENVPYNIHTNCKHTWLSDYLTLEELTSSDNTLLPCPFCGPSDGTFLNEPKILSIKKPTQKPDVEVECFFVECIRCEARGPMEFYVKAAKDSWNKRGN